MRWFDVAKEITQPPLRRIVREAEDLDRRHQMVCNVLGTLLRVELRCSVVTNLNKERNEDFFYFSRVCCCSVIKDVQGV